MAEYLMQARSSTTGLMVTWISATLDWAGASFPGPGAPELIAAHAGTVAAAGGGGGGSPGGLANEVQINDGAGGFAGASGVTAGTKYLKTDTVSGAASGALRLALDQFGAYRNHADDDDLAAFVGYWDADVSENTLLLGSDKAFTSTKQFDSLLGIAKKDLSLETAASDAGIFITAGTAGGPGATEVFWGNFAVQSHAGATAYGGGDGVFFFGEAGTNPSTNPAEGVIVYVDGADNTLKYRKASGSVRTLRGDAPSVNTAVDLTLTNDDSTVSVTASGKTITLPSTPTDGQPHSIKSAGAFTCTIAGGGHNIDGAASYVQAVDRECTMLRFNAGTNEWEIR